MCSVISSGEQWQRLLKEANAKSGFLGVLVWAPWHQPSVQLRDTLERLQAEQQPAMLLAHADADAVPQLAANMKVDAVPTMLVLQRGDEVARLEGADVPKMVQLVHKYTAAAEMQAAQDMAANAARDDDADDDHVRKRLEKLVRADRIMLFMKGSPKAPRCGFSKKMVALLQGVGANFGYFDILQDNEVRKALKEFANWKTYPMLFVDGELVGGLDVVADLHADGDLEDTLKLHKVAAEPKQTLQQRLQALVSRSPVMLFMKGTPEAPRCGFSRTIVELLRGYDVQLDTFDILSDDEVRQGLKTFSNWPTYPQLYVNGSLLGGLDIVKELHEDGELADALTA